VIVVTIALWLPELGSLAHSDAQAWLVFLTAQQAASALLCLALAGRKGWAAAGMAGAVWFSTQALDEWNNGNLWREQQWEYPLALALMLGAWLLRKNEAR
jgi:hypothetical protein